MKIILLSTLLLFIIIAYMYYDSTETYDNVITFDDASLNKILQEINNKKPTKNIDPIYATAFTDIDDQQNYKIPQESKFIYRQEIKQENCPTKPQYKRKSKNKHIACNDSIQKQYDFGSFNLDPFGIKAKNDFLDGELEEDPSQYYKKIYDPVRLMIEGHGDKIKIGANMPNYSNVAKISDVGKIKLDINKIPLPAASNYTFSNTPAFEFI